MEQHHLQQQQQQYVHQQIQLPQQPIPYQMLPQQLLMPQFRIVTQGPHGGPQPVIQGFRPNIILPEYPLPIYPPSYVDPPPYVDPNNTNPNKTNSVINNHNQRSPGGNPKRLKTDKQESNVQSGNNFSDVGFESVQKYIDSLEEENKSLKKDLEKLNDSKLCQVCMESDACIVFIPCGHLMTCVNCSPGLKECAVCRIPITSTVRTYFS